MTAKKYVAIYFLFMANAFAQEQSAMVTWADRPWNIRYLIFISDLAAFRGKLQSAREANARSDMGSDKSTYRYAATLLQPRNAAGMPALSMVLLEFDAYGRITKGMAKPSQWAARRDWLDRLVLVSQAFPQGRPYILAKWDQGVPGDVTFSPAVCTGWDRSRYLADWRLSPLVGSFGCREWTAQLYDTERPYIDITSYTSEGTFIGDLVGWSRLTDPPKPVIGLHGKIWLCIHECPNGEKPGRIRDISMWAKKHGFPMPQRPPRQPLYPDSDYLEDMREFDD